jgi:hypothetical protein
MGRLSQGLRVDPVPTMSLRHKNAIINSSRKPPGAIPRAEYESCRRVALFVGGSMDSVAHPAHYTVGIEVIDFIKSKMTDVEYRGYLMGNCIKYLSRYKYKNSPIEDLLKCRQYLDWLIDTYRHAE